MKTVFALLAVLATAAAFQPAPAFSRSSVAVNMQGWEPTPAQPPSNDGGELELGAGGMADTRNPDALEHEDPRKSISDAPSFEEYLKSRQA